EVVEVGGARALGREVRSDANLPARQPRALLRELVVRDADAERLVWGGLVQPELVQVVVLPAHGVLNRDVKVPEGVVVRHLDAAPTCSGGHGARAPLGSAWRRDGTGCRRAGRSRIRRAPVPLRAGSSRSPAAPAPRPRRRSGTPGLPSASPCGLPPCPIERLGVKTSRGAALPRGDPIGSPAAAAGASSGAHAVGGRGRGPGPRRGDPLAEDPLCLSDPPVG